MPPRAKFSREEIVKAGLGIVRNSGMDALTARALGKALGSSSCPIFTAFENMDEVQQEVVKAAKAVYGEYVNRGLSEPIAFKGVGTQYILFAKEEPRLFQLLFMSGKPVDNKYILQNIEDNYNKILASVMDGYGFSEGAAKELYMHLWLYSHGIATLLACNVCNFTSEEISERLTEVCRSLIISIKGGCKK